MNKCNYFDSGWCYAPDDVKTNTIQSACFEPEHCPYLKSQNQMTNEQILELASKHLRYFEDGWRGTEWTGTPENLLEFAQAIYEEGYDDGCFRATGGN